MLVHALRFESRASESAFSAAFCLDESLSCRAAQQGARVAGALCRRRRTSRSPPISQIGTRPPVRVASATWASSWAITCWRAFGGRLP